jgi:hypothetical protein
MRTFSAGHEDSRASAGGGYWAQQMGRISPSAFPQQEQQHQGRLTPATSLSFTSSATLGPQQHSDTWQEEQQQTSSATTTIAAWDEPEEPQPVQPQQTPGELKPPLSSLFHHCFAC